LLEVFHYHKFQDLLAIVPSQLGTSATKEDTIEAIWRTLIGDCFNTKSPAPAHFGVSFYYLVLHQMAITLFSFRMRESMPDPKLFWHDATLYEEFAQTGALPHRNEVVAQAELYYEEFLEGIEHGASQSGYFMPTKLPPMMAIRDRINPMILERCFIVTEKGRFGLAPRSAIPGDDVVFVRNARVPFIIRKVEGGNYEHVGEAYIHGLMHGELKSQGHLSLEEIILQ